MNVPARVSPHFAGRTIVCIASGPSLTAEDVDACRGGDRAVLAINDVITFAPWADALYACDRRWWEEHDETRAFTGLKFGLQRPKNRDDVTILDNNGDRGLELVPTGLRTGKNSGYQAINLAVHLGAARILLVGYDMQTAADGRVHFFGQHAWRKRQDPPPFELFLEYFDSMVAPLQALGIEVVNCSRSSALRCFPRAPLERALQVVAA